MEGFGATIEDGCITDSDTLVADVDAAIVDFEKQTAVGITEGLYKLGQALREALPKATTDCVAAQKKLEEMKEAIEQFASAKDFAYHVGQDLKVNGVSIFMDINQAIGAFKKPDYELSGQKIGDAIYLVAIGSEPKMEQDIIV